MNVKMSMMDLEARKYEFIRSLFKVEKASIMDKLEKVLKKEQQEEIVAYTVEGQPLTRSQYKKELLDAEAEIERGDYTTQEDLEKESENW